MERGTENYPVMVSYQPGVGTAKNTFGVGQDPANPQSNFPFRSTAGVLVREQGKYARKLGKRCVVGQDTSVDAMEIAAVLDQGTPVAVAKSKIAAVGILTEVEDKRTAGADTSEDSTALGGNLKRGALET